MKARTSAIADLGNCIGDVRIVRHKNATIAT